MKISHYIVTTLTGGIESVSRGLRRHQCFHKAGSSSVQQFPSVYTFRGGLKSGDGVEANPGDAGSISQTTDGGACPYGIVPASLQ